MKKYIYVLVGAAVIGAYLLGSGGVLGGASVVNPINPIFTNGFRVGSAGTQIIDKNGALTIAGTASFTGAVTGISTSTLSTLTVSSAATIASTTVSGRLSITGTATTTRTNGNILINSTSTGIVLKAASSGSAYCYLVTLSQYGNWVTSTASCQ